jgi:Glycosyl hydrolase family 12
MTRLTKLLTSVLISFAVSITLTSTAGASVTRGNTIAPGQEKFVSNGDYCVRADDFGSSTWLYNTGEQGFKTTKSTASSGRVTAYPNIFRGWQWGIGTKGNWPVRLSADNAPRADLTISQTWKGTYNSSLDLWFSTYPNKTKQANGAEVMVWLSHPNVAVGGRVVNVDGTAWYLNEWMTGGHGVSWRLIIFARVTQVSSVKGLWLNPFLRIAESHKWLRPYWYWTGVDAGFELWRGGKGLGVTYFNVDS